MMFCNTPVMRRRGTQSLWADEHVVLPDPQVAPSPLAPLSSILGPTAALSFVAAHTKTIKLDTGVIILSQRNPLVMSKELASVDVLSKGRLIFGVSVGYLRPEFDALGIPFEHKGARAIDYLRAMQAIWSHAAPSYTGRLVSYAGIQVQPQPVQLPIPIVIGCYARSRTACSFGCARTQYHTSSNTRSCTRATIQA